LSDFRSVNPQASVEVCPGWFGKIPSLGDFATRRLPRTFVEPWDEWLSSELSDARFVLADSWNEVYTQAPISCFSLGLGTVDDHTWHGILVPSFDRVGRQFPLTIAQSRPSHLSATPGPPWWAALVVGARRALESTSADGVDEALAAVAAKLDAHCLQPELATLEEGTGRWWTWSAPDLPDAAPCVTRGLPRGACFRQLLGAR
jgi:type VI secretion system protein ImpM